MTINIKKLTPANAWKIYYDDSIELFVSQFHADGITDVSEMCKQYSRDIPTIFSSVYTIEQLNYIAQLLEQYIKNEGYDPKKLYTVEQLEKKDDEMITDIVEIIKQNLKK